MEKHNGIRQKKWQTILALVTTSVLVVCLFGTMRQDSIMNAADVEIAETNEISSALKNGPQEMIVTKLEDMGWKQSAMTNLSPSAYCPGSVSGNKVSFISFAANYFSTNGNNEFFGWDSNWRGSGSALNPSIPISMQHSWELKAKVWMAACNDTTEFSMFSVKLASTNNSRTISSTAKYYPQGTSTPGIANITGKEVDMKLSYNAAAKRVTWTLDSTVILQTTNTIPDTATLLIAAQRGRLDGAPTKNTQSYMTFQSFKYTDYYLKATNHITDYANRKISGAVGSGHVIDVHPTILNNSNEVPANTQRFSGTVSFNPGNISNITPIGKMAAGQTIFTQTSSAYQDAVFEAKIDTGGVAYAAGQKFRLPLQVNDNYFGSAANFVNTTGVPADNWPNLKYDGGGGKKDQLPMNLNLVRDTCRELKQDVDYIRTIAGEPAQPNDHGWYNKNVAINFKSDPDEFNELNFSSATGDKKITTDSIDYTASNEGSFTIRGKDKNGNFTPTGETCDDGNTYSVFARKGTAAETEDLSAVTTETFRIDKEGPTLKLADKTNQSDPRHLKAEDALSGVDYIKWKGPDDLDYPQGNIIQIETDPYAVKGDKSPVPRKLPTLPTLGDYSFVAVDLAGNESVPLVITNERPELYACDKKLTFKETIQSFKPLTVHEAAAKDQEDGTYDASRLDWEIKKSGSEMVLYKGSGDDTLHKYLSIGTFEVTFFLNGTGTDSDGNKPDPERFTVKLTVTPEGPPDITISGDPGAGTVDGVTSTRPDGSRHYLVEDEKILIADTENPYSGGSLTDAEIKKEIEDHFNFKSQIPYPANSLNVDLKIYDDKGNDITGTPVSTLKIGSYTAVYVAADVSGCTTTLQLTYIIKENVTVTFHPGKGDYKDGSESRKNEIKANKAPEAKDIPDGLTELAPPARTCFIGWGTSLNAKETVDPTAIRLSSDTTYYAIYGPDINSNNIPDSKEAIFIFKSGDPEHAAYKYADKTVVGILAPAESAVSIPADKIPELLFERTEDTGYRLAGWKTDLTGEQVISAGELTAMGRRAGTKLFVTAVIEPYPIQAADKVKVTFFSSDPKNAPLKGGEGQSIYIDAPKEGEAVHLSESQLPNVNLGESCTLEGWKTEKTGGRLMKVSEVAKEKLYQGETVTLVAYVNTPPKREVVEKEKTVKEKSTVNTSKTEKNEQTKKAKREKLKTVTFAFCSSNNKHGTIKKGDGFTVTKTVNSSGTASVKSTEIPGVAPKGSYRLIGWKTSLTGNRLLTAEDICQLNVPAGTTVVCTAGFAYDEVKVSGMETGRSLTSIIGDERVPLGSGIGGMRDGEDARNCRIHYFMITWLILSVITITLRLRNRIKGIKCITPGPDQRMGEYVSYDSYAEVADGQTTTWSDYLFAAVNIGLGCIQYIMGTCILELPLLVTGGIFVMVFLTYMKCLDKKVRSLKKEMEQNMCVKEPEDSTKN